MAFNGKFTGGFLGTSSKPLVGTLYSHPLENSLKEATITSTAQLVPGDPVVVLVAQASQPTGQLDKFNPDNQVITKKATTTNTGKNDTAACGFLIVNSNDRVSTGGVGLPQKGQRAVYAPLGQGAIIWLEVASANKSAFSANLDSNTALTIDTTNGGVKLANGADVLGGARLISGLIEGKKIVNNGGVGELADCLVVAVQLM